VGEKRLGVGVDFGWKVLMGKELVLFLLNVIGDMAGASLLPFVGMEVPEEGN